MDDIKSSNNSLSQLVRVSQNFGKARGFQALTCTQNSVVTLTIPSSLAISYAQLRLYTTSGAANTPVAWYTMDGTTPAANNGIPLLGWEMLDITDFENLNNFKIYATGGTEVLYVQYFSTIV